MDNDDRVEGIYSGDEFHGMIQTMVSAYGRGYPVAIVWDENASRAYFSPMRGMVVCQQQFGMCAYSFSVVLKPDGFQLRMLEHKMKAVSDYFTTKEGM